MEIPMPCGTSDDSSEDLAVRLPAAIREVAERLLLGKLAAILLVVLALVAAIQVACVATVALRGPRRLYVPECTFIRPVEMP